MQKVNDMRWKFGSTQRNEEDHKIVTTWVNTKIFEVSLKDKYSIKQK